MIHEKCQGRKTDLENRLGKVYDKIEEAEDVVAEAKPEKRANLTEKQKSMRTSGQMDSGH